MRTGLSDGLAGNPVEWPDTPDCSAPRFRNSSASDGTRRAGMFVAGMLAYRAWNQLSRVARMASPVLVAEISVVTTPALGGRSPRSAAVAADSVSHP